MLTNNFFFFRMPLKQQQTFFGNITKISQEKTWRRACMESGFGFEFWICHSAKCLQINIFFLIYLKGNINFVNVSLAALLISSSLFLLLIVTF